MISIEAQLASRFPDFPQRHPRAWRGTVLTLRHLLREADFKAFEERYPRLEGFNFVEQVLDHLQFAAVVSDRERERIPVSGPVVIVANHPIGSLDGLALLSLIGQVRRDVRVVATTVLAAIEPLRSLLLPVDNFNGRTSRENLRAIERQLQQGGAVIVFPAGEVSRAGPRGVRDGAWRPGFLRLAAKVRAPIVPLHINARNSMAFYGLSLLARPLSTLWLVREMFKHRSGSMSVRIGEPVAHAAYSTLPLDARATAKAFRRHVYRLASGGDRRFAQVLAAVAHPEPRGALRSELRAAECLGQLKNGTTVYLYRNGDDSAVLREIGRLREISFRAVGEGSGRRRDLDSFDRHYDHLVLWDDEELEIVGAYRLRRTGRELIEGGALYTHTLFRWSRASAPLFAEGVELGRSFIQPRYWGSRSLDLLWCGIGLYLRRYPSVRYLFGPVSISDALPSSAKALLVGFYRHFFPASRPWASARRPYEDAVGASRWQGLDYAAAFVELKQELQTMDVNVPTLYKQYAELCEGGGVEFADFNIDEDFADCIDGLVIVDLQKMKPSRRKRYLGVAEETEAKEMEKEAKELAPA